MIYKQRLIALVLFLLSGGSLFGQDPVFSQFYTAPMMLNPALAGNTLNARIGLHYRNQFPTFSGPAFRTYAASVDQYFNDLNSGVGIMFWADDAGDGIYRTIRASGFYSYRIRVQDNLYIKWGVEASYQQNRLDWQRLLFADQIDPELGPIAGAVSMETQPENLNNSYFDISTGALVYNRLFYAGISIKHINSPDQSILNNGNEILNGLPVRMNIHAGAEIELTRGKRNFSNSYISPNILFAKQGDYAQINAGAYIQAGFMFLGGWYRHANTNADAVIGLIGFQQGILKVGYSFDYTISDLSGGNGGTHELSLIINLDQSETNKRKNKSIDYSDCLNLFR